MKLCTIIIPTYNNLEYLNPCLESIVRHTSINEFVDIVVVNNGNKDYEKYMFKNDNIRVINAEANLGWEGGLKRGLEGVTTDFVCFMNDDTYIPLASFYWLHTLIAQFQGENIAAVGPCSNVVMGAQNIFSINFHPSIHEVPYLIGFCMVVRRSHLEQAGGIDTTLPGGDDIDLSIRLHAMGKALVVCKSAFVYHHGFKTGEKVHGGPHINGGWNSLSMTEETNMALIRKHGFSTFYKTINGSGWTPVLPRFTFEDIEGDYVRKYVGDGVVVEMGCGGNKTVPNAIGVDRAPSGEKVPLVLNQVSAADIVSDASSVPDLKDGQADYLIARHILEHCIDAVSTLKEWARIVKKGGKMIMALPDHRHCNTIPLSAEHVHAYTPDSLRSIVEMFGFKQVAFEENYNGISFISVFEKGA